MLISGLGNTGKEYAIQHGASSGVDLVKKPTYWEVVSKHLATLSGAKDLVVKPIHYAAEWMKLADPKCPYRVGVAAATKDAKNWFSLAELPGRVAKIFEGTGEFFEKRTPGSLLALINKVAKIVSPLSDSIKAVSKQVHPLSDAFKSRLEFIGNAAMCFGTAYDTAEQGRKHNEANKQPVPVSEPLKTLHVEGQHAETRGRAINIARNASYFALGALGLAALPVAPWVPLALATSGLGFTVIGHFHQEIAVKPIEKARIEVAGAA